MAPRLKTGKRRGRVESNRIGSLSVLSADLITVEFLGLHEPLLTLGFLLLVKRVVGGAVRAVDRLAQV